MGWALSANNDTALALAALHCAVRGRRFAPAGLLHHTDRGTIANAAFVLENENDDASPVVAAVLDALGMSQPAVKAAVRIAKRQNEKL